MHKPELLDSKLPAFTLGEGPLWDVDSGRLVWVDIKAGAIHRYNLQRHKHERCGTGDLTGFAVPASEDRLITGIGSGLYLIDFMTREKRCLMKPDKNFKGLRFNDGKCDRAGRIWVGTIVMEPEGNLPEASLYKFDGLTLKCADKGFFNSNGKGWSPDDKTFYHADTYRNIIWKYDFDLENGAIANRQKFICREGTGQPDGLCVDSQGRLFVALYGGHGVEIYTPEGTYDGYISLPVPNVTSCAFGGEDLKTLFVTTAKDGLDENQIRESPLSGQVFAVAMEVAGMPERRFKSVS